MRRGIRTRANLVVILLSASLIATVKTQETTDQPFKAWGSPHRPTAAEYKTFSDATVVVLHDHRRILKTATSTESHLTQITVNVTAFKRSFVMKMTKNRYLFTSGYVEKLVSDTEVSYNNFDYTTDHCYYTGTVNGQSQSTAAISTCDGILGYFGYDNDGFNIEPVTGTLTGSHRVYRDSDILAPKRDRHCGNAADASSGMDKYTSLNKFFRRRKKRSYNWPQDADGRTKVVEFYVVNDYSQFGAMGFNATTTITRTKNVVNIASVLFQPLDIYLALVGIEVWTDRSRIVVNASDGSSTLDQFCKYRQTNISPFHPNDNAQFITNKTFTFNSMEIIGLAKTPGMCDYIQSCAFTSDTDASPIEAAATMAHEMGHNFNFQHDNQLPFNCSCNDPSGVCLMDTNTQSPTQTQWSQCSKDALKASFDQDMDYCLHNIPQLLYDGTPVCGNGILETGEDCDCGGASTTLCNPDCCSNTTCRLLTPATCASGRCCDIPNCLLKPITSVCRQSSGPCDLSEYCSGVEALCPSDVYRQDGTACNDTTGSSAYCYEGQCRSHRSQCHLWFGTNVDKAADACYNESTAGLWHGHCGYNASAPNTYFKCAPSDQQCGLTFCNTVVDISKSRNQLQHFNFSLAGYTLLDTGENCSFGMWNAFYAGGYVEDPALVPDGAACGTGMVCNNLGQCHCGAGYAPPDCSQPGNGGSIHSNPIVLQTTTQQTTTSQLTTTTVAAATSTTQKPTTTALPGITLTALLTTTIPLTVTTATATPLATGTTTAPLLASSPTTTVRAPSSALPITTTTAAGAAPLTTSEMKSTATGVNSPSTGTATKPLATTTNAQQQSTPPAQQTTTVTAAVPAASATASRAAGVETTTVPPAVTTATTTTTISTTTKKVTTTSQVVKTQPTTVNASATVPASPPASTTTSIKPEVIIPAVLGSATAVAVLGFLMFRLLRWLGSPARIPVAAPTALAANPARVAARHHNPGGYHAGGPHPMLLHPDHRGLPPQRQAWMPAYRSAMHQSAGGGYYHNNAYRPSNGY